MWLHFSEGSRGAKIRDQKYNGGQQGLGEGDAGSMDLTMTWSQIYKTEFWNLMVVILHHINITHIHQLNAQKVTMIKCSKKGNTD